MPVGVFIRQEADVLLSLLLLACTSGDDTADSDTDSYATIAITTPEDGATVCGTPLHVELDIENFTLVDPAEGSDPHPGEGHVDVWLNGQSVDMTPTESFDIPDVEPGEYQLRVELVAADHTAIEPYAGSQIYLTVDPTACPQP